MRTHAHMRAPAHMRAHAYARARTWVIDLSHLSHLSQAKEKQAMTSSCGVTGCVTGVTG